MPLDTPQGPLAGPAPDEVFVTYRFTESITDAELRECAAVLSVEEAQRCSRFVFARDRRDFTVAHALVRRTLSSCGNVPPLDWRFETNAQGKPAVTVDQSATLTFNLSHTHGLVACAVAHLTPVGVDVESVERQCGGPDIAERYFSPSERRMLDVQPAAHYHRRFIELWTLKESYIKAVGIGLSHPLDNFSFEFDGEGDLRFEAPPGENASGWQFCLAAPDARYRMSLAVGRDSPTRRYRIRMQNTSAPGDTLLEPLRESRP